MSGHQLYIDIETYSDVDLKKNSVYRYTESPAFEIMMAAWAVDDGPVQLALGAEEINGIPGLWDPSVEKIAHNAPFERVCFSAFLRELDVHDYWNYPRYLDPEDWTDTAALAAEAGYPRKLEHLAVVLGGEQKDTAGTHLINFFCKPDRNGNRRRPEDHPEKWQLFKDYCVQDVVTLRDVHRELPDWPTKTERDLYMVDQRINDRGIPVDVELAAHAVDMAAVNAEVQKAEVVELTGLENPNSNPQMLGWLQEQGVAVANLQAATVEALLAGDDLDETPRRVLELRQELALVASKKFSAAISRTSADGRLRGAFQFCGAHTGRWAGRGVQLQNLPREKLDTETETLAAILDLKLGFDTDARTLKALVRAMFTGPFTVVDYAAIEARVVAWLAGEKWALDAFALGRDIYVETAERMGDNLTRADGKVACIAAGSLVLTGQGLVPIEDVKPRGQVWDGKEWVLHDGAVYMGERDVIEYDGLTATEDHLVWVEGSPEPVQFGHAAASGARLQRSGAGGRPVWVGGSNQPPAALHPGLVGRLRPDTVPGLQGGAVAAPGEPDVREVPGVSGLQPAPKRTDQIEQGPNVRTAAMRGSDTASALRRAWDRISLPIRALRGSMGAGEHRTAGAGDGAGPDQQRGALRAGQPPVGHARGEREQPEQHAALRVGPGVLALRGEHRPEETLRGVLPGADTPGRGPRRGGASERVAIHRGKVAVYDLLNAGPRHRFTVSGVLVHNCLALGYNGGVNSLRVMGAQGSDEKLQFLVTQWREANPAIVSLWREMGDSFRFGGPVGEHVNIEKDGADRLVRLPSGRAVVYRGLKGRWVQKWGKRVQVVSFASTKAPGLREDTYGGKLTENITQAVARDVLADALLRLEARGYESVGHVHDEILVLGADATSVQRVTDVMVESPPWAAGLPIAAEGFTCARYKKD